MNTNDLTLFRKGLLMIAVPLAFQLAFVWIMAGLVSQSYRDAADAMYRRNAVEESDTLFLLCLDGFTSVLAYGMNKNPAQAERFDASRREIRLCQVRLRELCGTDRVAHRRLDQANDLVDGIMDFLEKVVAERASGAKNPLSFLSFMQRQDLFFSFATKMRSLKKELNDPQIQAEALARRNHERAHRLIVVALAGGLLITILMALSLARFFSRRITNRLAIISDNSRRLAEGMSLHPPLEGKDEVGLLDRTFHEMVAALEEASRREKQIINNSEDVICALSASGTILFVSEAVTRNWIYKPESIRGRSIFDLADSPEDADCLESFLGKVRQNEAPRPVRVGIRTGDVRQVVSSWAAHWSETDASFFCVVHDITAQRERERVRERFVNLIGTRLSVPLKEIETQLEELTGRAADSLKPRGKVALANGMQAVERIVQLVGELLELEQMQEGVLHLNLRSRPLAEVIQAACASVQSMADYKKVQLEAAATDLVLFIDDKRLTQVMVNLLSNALKYTAPESRVAIEIEDKGAEIVVSILDQGPGIPEEALGTLFGRFRRLERDVDRQTTGTGLGLAICKAIIEQHGGRIGAGNRPSGGSRFWISLPLRN